MDQELLSLPEFTASFQWSSCCSVFSFQWSSCCLVFSFQWISCYSVFSFQWSSCCSVFSFQWSSCCSVCNFQCDVLSLIVCHLVLFLFDIGLHVILRISVSDYPFSIFKLFLKNDIIENIIKDIFNLNGIELFGSSLHPVVCRRAHVSFTLFVFV